MRNEAESASGSTLLSIAPAGPVGHEGGAVVFVVAGKASWVVAGECGDIRSSKGISISVSLIKTNDEIEIKGLTTADSIDGLSFKDTEPPFLVCAHPAFA